MAIEKSVLSIVAYGLSSHLSDFLVIRTYKIEFLCSVQRRVTLTVFNIYDRFRYLSYDCVRSLPNEISPWRFWRFKRIDPSCLHACLKKRLRVLTPLAQCNCI